MGVVGVSPDIVAPFLDYIGIKNQQEYANNRPDDNSLWMYVIFGLT
jgi:hypothetical protein